ncbi:hypothetical protein QUA35_16375 [Microcoleus sp. N9_B2]|uniref:hypothetical protein n=1 Tax=unclassified Microcoleus TaxID=2642155 RepID=UPI002FD38FD8
MAKYSDLEINNLIGESKPLPLNWQSQIQLKEAGVSKKGDLDIKGVDGNKFRIILRQSRLNLLDFSIIIGVYPSGSNKLFHLRRYDGKSHEHTNPIEKERFYDFHIHKATERYQDYGTCEEDKYAEPTDRFSNYGEAIDSLIKDCGFELPDDPQRSLF